jgi:hypothetical protein
MRSGAYDAHHPGAFSRPGPPAPSPASLLRETDRERATASLGSARRARDGRAFLGRRVPNPSPWIGILTSRSPRPSPGARAPAGRPPAIDPGGQRVRRCRKIDVEGGPGESPTARPDLLLVDRNGTTLRVYTLLSTGSGSTAKADTPWRVGGASAPYGSADVHNWRPAKLNRDGCSDLVHLLPANPGVRVEYLLSNCDGTWTSGNSPTTSRRQRPTPRRPPPPT